ncbi:MAG: glutathione peroxidase [Alphaproteobacteria bacterium]|nr:glutathione peroxidase [Alphaproteobacteria bacterium]
MTTSKRSPVSRTIRHILVGVLLMIGAPVSANPATKSAHDFVFTAIEGGPLPLSQFAGQAILVVNTASQCGFTHQYADLAEIWQRYRDQGLVVLAVPSNDFGGQEPGSEDEIKEFCEVTYGIDFPMTSKVHVRGDKAHEFYKWAAAELGSRAKPRWNFHKYLVSPGGELVDWFSTATSPTSPRVIVAIETHLPANERVGAAD